MDEFFKLFGNADQLITLSGAILILLGIVTPKRFVGIEVDWTLGKSICVIIIGIVLLAFSFSRPLGSYTASIDWNYPAKQTTGTKGEDYGSSDFSDTVPKPGDYFDTYTPDRLNKKPSSGFDPTGSGNDYSTPARPPGTPQSK